MSQPTQLDSWLKSFPREETEARGRELERELGSVRDALALHDTLTKSNGSQPDASATGDGPPKSRRDAIRRVLRERGNEPMSSRAIKDTMLERGWLTEDQVNLYYAAVSTMTKKGPHLLRLQDGRYMLPPGKTGGDIA
jgi:hypothetical protein